jgi:hypothetical protein
MHSEVTARRAPLLSLERGERGEHAYVRLDVNPQSAALVSLKCETHGRRESTQRAGAALNSRCARAVGRAG